MRIGIDCDGVLRDLIPAVIDGIKDINIISDIPVILCVSTDDNINQSIDRSGGKYNKGEDSAIAALKMIKFNQWK